MSEPRKKKECAGVGTVTTLYTMLDIDRHEIDLIFQSPPHLQHLCRCVAPRCTPTPKVNSSLFIFVEL